MAVPHLLIRIGGISGVIPPTTKKVGWPNTGYRRRHDPEELERRLKEQRDNTFSRRRFEEIVEEAQQKAAELKSKAAKAELERAIEAVQEAVEVLPDNSLTEALEAAVIAKNTASVIEQARLAYEAAMAAIEDDEEAIMLLLQ